MCFTVDHKLLFTQFTDQDVEDGFFLYTTFYNSPPAIKVSPVCPESIDVVSSSVVLFPCPSPSQPFFIFVRPNVLRSIFA